MVFFCYWLPNFFCVYITFQLPAGCLTGDSFQVAIHAIGDKANDLILDMYGLVASTNGMRDRRFRVTFLHKHKKLQ